MKVLIIGSSKLPIPAVEGGAVPNLIEELISVQENQKRIKLYCCSLWNKKAEVESKKYKQTKFIWAKVPNYIFHCDKFVRWALQHIIKKDRTLSLGFAFQVLWYTNFVAKLLKNQNFDYVIFENSVVLLSSLKKYGNHRKYENRYFIHMHSVPRKYYRNEEIFSNARKILCISNYVAHTIESDRRLRLDANKLFVFYNCIDTDYFKPIKDIDISKLKKQYNIPLDKKIVTFVGRISKDKGIEEAIKAIEFLNDQDVILLIVGSNFYASGLSSPYEEKVKQMAKPIMDKIIFTGYVPYSDMPYIYNLSDIVLLPSMWEEPAGMTIIEAMACGKPVITTISGGIPEYTGNGNCILLKRNSKIAENISNSMKELLNSNNYELRKKAQKQASKFNKSHYYDEFIDILSGGKNVKI
jgi:spore coat protein SA